MTNLLRNTFDFNLWMFTTLMVESDKWAWSIKGSKEVSFKFKQKFNQVLDSNRAFLNHIKDNNVLDTLEDSGEWFSKALEIIHGAPTLAVKEELILVLREYVEGRVETCSDFLPRSQVVEFVSKFSIVPKELIEKAYDEYKASLHTTPTP